MKIQLSALKLTTVVLFVLTCIIQGCSLNNVKTDDSLKVHFEKYKADGCFGIFDNSRGIFTIYNLERLKKPYTPASTFKIPHALIALQTGKLLDDSTVIKWDGVVRENPEWNQDLSLFRAFQLSAVPHFQAVARLIGRDTMQAWLDTVKYGNKKIGAAIDSFWLNQTLKITPDEQLGMVKRLYFRQLPFRGSVQESVKKMMIRENNSVYQLAFKTGWGETENGNPLGWMVGWIEENRHVYPFVLNFEIERDKAAELPVIREALLKDILTDIGFFKGRM
jgi:beta-lactamase class D